MTGLRNWLLVVITLLMVLLSGANFSRAQTPAPTESAIDEVTAEANRLFELEKYEEAQPLFVKILEKHRAQLGENHPNTATSHNQLAINLSRLGRYDEAAPYLLKALNIRQKVLGEQHPDTAESYNDVAYNFSKQGRYDKAEQLYRKALNIRVDIWGEKHPDTARSYNNLAFVLKSQSRFGEADPLYRKAFDIVRSINGKDDPLANITNSNIATNLGEMGRYEEAEPRLREVLQTWVSIHGKDHSYIGISSGNLAKNLDLQGRYREAEPFYRSGLAIFTSLLGDEHPFTATGNNGLAANLNRQKRFKEAEPHYRNSLHIYQITLGEGHPFTATAYNGVATNLFDQGKFEEAQPLFLRALALRYNIQGENHVDLADSFAGIGKLLFEQNKDVPKASFLLKKAVNILQGTRQNMAELGSGTQRAFVEKWRDTYLYFQQILIEQGRFAEAEQVGRMLKETEYMAFVRSQSTSTKDDPLVLNSRERDWEVKLSSWLDRPNQLSKQISNIQKKRSTGAELSLLETKQLFELEEAYDQSYEEFRVTVDGWLKDVRSNDDEEVQEEARALELASSERIQGIVGEIGDDVALLQLVAFEESLHMFLITPNAFKHVAVPVTRSDLFQTIFAARKEIDKGRDPEVSDRSDHRKNLRTHLGQLYKWLIKPLDTELADAGTSTLMLNVQGEIRYVPFAALWDGDNWLTERFQLSIFTPAAQTRFITPISMKKGKAFGLSNAIEGFSALPAVQDELNYLMGSANQVGVLDGTSVLNTQFTRASLEASLISPSPVLHIASHFAIRPGNEAASFLVLGDGNRLSVADISRSSKLRFKGVELLTLSACETAIGGKGAGMEIEGIGALAQNKGAASVMATLWAVSDDSTPLFMRDFYDGIANQKLTKAAALQAAQLKLIRSQLDNHPFYWAPFIIMGNWR